LGVEWSHGVGAKKTKGVKPKKERERAMKKPRHRQGFWFSEMSRGAR